MRLKVIRLQHRHVICAIPPARRNDYISALKKAQTNTQGDEHFIAFIAEMVYESQKDYLRMLKALA